MKTTDDSVFDIFYLQQNINFVTNNKIQYL